MPDRATTPSPWYAQLYPHVEAATYDHVAARRSAIQAALRIGETTAIKNRDWINRICSLAKVTPTQLAKEASLSPSTLNRFLKQTTSSANLSASTLAAIMEAAERLVESAFADAFKMDKPAFDFDEAEILWKNVKPFRMVRNVTMIGFINSDLFTDADSVEYKSENFFDVKVPIKGAHADKTVIALEYFTDYPCEYLEDNDLVFCVPLWKQTWSLSDGERVVVHRRNADQRVETSLRDVFFDKKGGCWLGAVGGESERFSPIYIGRDPSKLHSDDVSVSFLVIGSYHWAW